MSSLQVNRDNATAIYPPGENNVLSPSTPILLAIILLMTLLATRTLSSQHKSAKLSNGAHTPPMPPYWLPILGHIPNMALSANSFLRNLRNIYADGILTLNFFGKRHNIIYTPSLATAILNTKSNNADNEAVAKRIMTHVFGFPTSELDKYDAALAELVDSYKHISVDPGLGQMVECTVRKTKESINNLVTFMESPVDQMPWEKAADVRVIEQADGEQVVEASLFPLVRNYCAWIANPSLLGSDFLENFPEFFDDLWTMDRAFLFMAAGLPRWAPIPSVTRAHIAHKRNLERIDTWHEAMEKHWNGEDPGPKFSSLDDVSALEKARMPIYRKHKFSIRARASVEHTLMWAANANSNSLVFWMINHIYEDRALLAMLREEIAPYVEVKQVETGLPISEPPQFRRLDVNGLCNECPLLKSCYVESLRIDTAPWSFKQVHQDFVLQGREKDARPWLLRKGDYAHVAHDLHNTDPHYFENPLVWKADRHVRYDDKKKTSADLGTIRPYGKSNSIVEDVYDADVVQGGGVSMCKGRAFAFKEIMLFSAAIISLWDMVPAGGGPWKMPRPSKATGVYSTYDDTRVWLKRRRVAVEGSLSSPS